MKLVLGFFILILFHTPLARAACTSPAGDVGHFNYHSNDYYFCDGTNWISLAGSAGAACSAPGALNYDGAAMRYCRGGTNVWVSLPSTDSGVRQIGQKSLIRALFLRAQHMERLLALMALSLPLLTGILPM